VDEYGSCNQPLSYFAGTRGVLLWKFISISLYTVVDVPLLRILICIALPKCSSQLYFILYSMVVLGPYTDGFGVSVF
jgi:hypothetical protein